MLPSHLIEVDCFQQQKTLHRYRVIRLWEEDSAPFLADTALLPLAPLTRADSPKALLEEVAEQRNRDTMPTKSPTSKQLYQTD